MKTPMIDSLTSLRNAKKELKSAIQTDEKLLMIQYRHLKDNAGGLLFKSLISTHNDASSSNIIAKITALFGSNKLTEVLEKPKVKWLVSMVGSLLLKKLMKKFL